MDFDPYFDTMGPPLRSWSDTAERVCRAWSRYSEYDEAEVRRALVTDEGAVIAVEAAERIVACCVAGRVVTAGVDLATCEMEGSHDLGSEHQEACRSDPFQTGPCLAAYRCSVGGGASGQDALEYAAEPWEKAPCCSEGWIVVGRPEVPSAALPSAASGQTCHTDCWAQPRTLKRHAETARPARLGVPGHLLMCLGD
jgi:hypothetical protein